MAGKHLISSSLFIVSGSPAEFKNGITSSLGLTSSGEIVANNFDGIGNFTSPLLKIGSESAGVFYETNITASTGETITLSASGNFSHFMFIKNLTLVETGSNSRWETITKGNSNGFVKTDSLEQTFNEEGVYEYFILGSNTESKKTSFGSIIVTVKEEKQALP